MTEESLQQELAAARATIASQALQIHQLQQVGGGGAALNALRDLMELSGVIGATVGQTPFRQLLIGITEAARRLFEARAASILLLDPETNELVFEAGTDTDVIGRRFPAHQGIAGWTIMSGEPLAIGDVRRDPRFAHDFAQSTGYVPTSILSVPMFSGEDTIGVVQVLDKATAASFGLDDMELLGLFASPAAIAVEQARTVQLMGKLFVEELERHASEHGDGELLTAAHAALSDDATIPQQTLELARLVHQVARRSDRNRRLALEIMASIAKLG